MGITYTITGIEKEAKVASKKSDKITVTDEIEALKSSKEELIQLISELKLKLKPLMKNKIENNSYFNVRNGGKDDVSVDLCDIDSGLIESNASLKFILSNLSI